jgi:hypothetical protein
MARRSATKAADEATTTPTPEVTESTTETPTETSAKTEDAPIDLSGFQAAVTSAIDEADTSTGELPTTSVDAVNKVYREIDGLKAKNAARSWLDEQMKAAILGKDILRARVFVNIKDGLSAGSTSGPKAPADPTQAFVQKVVALRLATDEVLTNVPEGVNENWTDDADKLVAELTPQLNAYRDFVNSDDADAEQPEVSPVVRQVFKLAASRATSGGGSRVSGGPRRDIEKHITQVFENLDSGAFLSIAEISKTASTEYGEDRPSAGAVSARMFPKGKELFSGDAFKAVEAADGKPRGVVKL